MVSLGMCTITCKIRKLIDTQNTYMIVHLAPGNGQAEAPLTITNPAPAVISKIYAITVINEIITKNILYNRLVQGCKSLRHSTMYGTYWA